MKAIRVHTFGGPDVLRFEDVDDPKVGPGQIRIDVKAVGINPVDTYIRNGVYAKLPDLPYTPGTDAAGIVKVVSKDAMNVFKPGDRVYTAGVVGGNFTGAYAEKIVADAKYVHPLPDGVSFEQGAGVYVPYATAYYALWMRAQGRPGETVLIHGASGGVGLALVQMARAAGFLVVGTAGTSEGRDLARSEGAHAVYDHGADGYLQTAVGDTGSKGFDIIFEMLANVNLGRDLTALAPDGRVVVIGSRGPVEINPRDTMGRNASILGMSLWNLTNHEQATIHAALYAGLDAGVLRPVVGKTFPLAHADQAHEAIMQPSGAAGKIVLTI